MTYPQQQPHQQPPVVAGPHPQSPAGWPAPQPAPPAQRSRAVPILLGVLALVVLIVAGGIAAVAFLTGGDDLTEATAQRVCRTAFANEFQARQAGMAAKDVLVSTQGIDLVETWKDGDGFKVNGTVRFTLTAWPIEPQANTINLTCTATGSDDKPVTSVANRD
jgi:hypothetical protein